MVFSRAELTRSKIPEESAARTELHEDTLSLSQHARSSQTAQCSAVKANILYCSDAGVAGRIISLFARDENRRLLIWGRCNNHESLNHQILKSSNLVINTLSPFSPSMMFVSQPAVFKHTGKHAHVAGRPRWDVSHIHRIYFTFEKEPSENVWKGEDF